MYSEDDYKRLYKYFAKADGGHDHAKAVNKLSDKFDDISNDESLSEDDKEEKRIEILSKMKVETSLDTIHAIKKMLICKYVNIICIISGLFWLSFDFFQNESLSTFISAIGLAICILCYLDTVHRLTFLKNDFVELNKELLESMKQKQF